MNTKIPTDTKPRSTPEQRITTLTLLFENPSIESGPAL